MPYRTATSQRISTSLRPVVMNLPQPLRRRGIVWLAACLACLALLAVYDRFAWTREIAITVPPRETPPPVLVSTSQEPREELLNDIVELREFNVEDNPAYRPETELSPTAGDTAGSAIRSKVTELLSKGASHIISHVLSGRRNTGDASPPSQTGQGVPQQVQQQVQQQQQQQPPQSTQFQQQPLQQAQKPAQEQVVVHFNPPQQQQQVQPQQQLQFDQQQQYQLQLQHQQFQQQQAQQAAKEEPKRFTPPHQVLVHLDLKGAPPSVPFLRDVIALSAGLGATGLLIEWEDKFPYWGELAPVAAGNAYTREQAQEILDTARKYNMTVMPLVQTFGHLEYVLKLPQFASIREDPASPQALCPSRNESDRLVETLLDQVMSLHTGAERVHIGSDEVFVLGKCDLCRRRRRDDLLLGHIALTANYVRRKYNATAVLWEDMLRNAASSKLREYGLDSGLVEPMLWWYTPDVRRYVSPMVWRHAERMYPHVWGAGAYKGAFGSALFSPIIDKQVQNNLDWTELLAEEDSRLTGGVRGLVLTGWSRYDHFATPAELMAAAVPSLAFSIAAVCRGALDDVASEAAQRALGCPRPTPLRQLSWPYLYAEMSQCRFPGHRVYMMMDRYNRTFTAVREYLTKFESGHESSWLGRYNERHNLTSVLKVREELPKLMSLRHNTARMLKPLYQELIAIYDRDLVLEWLEYRMLPLLEDLDALHDRMEALKKRTNFPARPLKDYSKRLISYMDEFVSGWRPSR